MEFMKTFTWLTSALVFALLTTFARGQSPTASVTFVESNKVAAAFAKGIPFLENSQFKVLAGRREAPGIPEIHTKDTDIIHVLEGSATFVTGGKATEPRTIAPDEIRGKEIQGGESRRVTKGDVIVVPNGVPHWFKQVDGPLLYYVVKVTACAGAAK
jgi:quercetin dioxygenase-like cupin family protein